MARSADADAPPRPAPRSASGKKFATPPVRFVVGSHKLPHANGRAGKIFPRSPTPFFQRVVCPKKITF